MSGFPNQEFGYELGVSACYAGIIGNKLVMAGGCNFAGKSAAEGGPKYFYKGIYTAEITEDSVLVWKQVGELPSPVAYGVSISRSGEMILVGGNNADGGLTSVFRLKLAEDGEAILDTLPSLPFALDNMSGAASGNTIYVAGGNRNGSPSTSMLSLNLDEPEARLERRSSISGCCTCTASLCRTRWYVVSVGRLLSFTEWGRSQCSY
ncbi:hypothetical protein NXX53_19220 [Bacteroides salyersiae]|nr:hypothetical protein [Bacteroides salyersiae]